MSSLIRSCCSAIRSSAPLALIVAFLLLATGCGGSGGNGGDGDVAAATGSVALVLTDAPTDEFVEAWVTVTRIELLEGDGDNGRQELFSGRETFDLLALENVSEPFAISDDVPAGTYSKLRMSVDEIELRRPDGLGGLESVYPRLPGGNRIDLNPRGGFEVEPDKLLAVRLDMDARRSIQINETGNGQVLFRSQVFVEIMSVDDPGRLLAIEGVVREIDRDTSPAELLVCEVSIRWRSADEENDRHCLDVFAGDGTSIFDASGEATDLEDVEPGDRVAVLGRFVRHEERLALAAEVIELGGSEAFMSLTGIVSGAYDDASATILVDLDPEQGFEEGTTLEVELVDETKLFSDAGESLDVDDLVVDARVEMDGVLALSEDMADVLRAAVIFIDPPVEVDPRETP